VIKGSCETVSRMDGLTDLLQLFDEDFDLLLSAAVPYNSHVLVHGYNHIVEIIWMPQSQLEYSSPYTPNSGSPNSTDIILRVETSKLCVWSHPLKSPGPLKRRIVCVVDEWCVGMRISNN
jgi:hypothetical protein